jgi:16S rRNA processing protein RimM
VANTESEVGPGDDAVLVGKVAGFFGVKGWIKVFSFTDPRQAILDYGPWWLKQSGEWQQAVIAEGQRHGKSVIVRLDGVTDRDEAARWLGCEIAVASETLPAPSDGSYYWRDLEGLEVLHRDGRSLGKVKYVMETGAHDVLVTNGDKERLIPFVMDEVVLGVDVAGGVIDVDWEWD